MPIGLQANIKIRKGQKDSEGYRFYGGKYDTLDIFHGVLPVRVVKTARDG